MIAAVLVLSLLVQEPEPPPPARRPRTVRSAVKIFIEETPEEDYAHPYYEQAIPVEHRTGTASVGSEVWFRTVCRPQEDDRSPVLFTVPDHVPALALSGILAVPRMTVKIPGDTIIGGRQRNDPIISTKAGVFGAGSPSDGRDAPVLYGTDLDYIAVPDVTGWSPTSWLPEGTSFRLFARALFGSLEIADVSTDLQLYGGGPRLGIPVARWGALELDCTLSAGPGYLHTGVGDALGFDGGVGLRASLFFTRSLSLLAALEANYFRAGNVSAFGPVVNVGFNLSW
jgi:hypothetical protein